MKKSILSVLLICLAVALAVSGCSKKAEDKDMSWENVQKSGRFVMGFDDSFPPMGYKLDGEHVGFDIDVAKVVTERLGLELVLQPIIWDVKEQELATNNIDAIWNGFTMTPERLEMLTFSKPYMNNKQVIIVMADSDITTLDDMAGKTLSLQRNSSASDALAKHPELQASLTEIYEFDDNIMAMTDLETKNSDAVLMDIVVANFNYVAKNPGKYRVLATDLGDEEFGIGFRKGDIALKDKIEATLIEMAADGTLAEISTKWFGSDITTLQ